MKDVSDIVGNYKKFKELKKEQSKAKKLQAQLELSKEISKNLDDDRREARRLANELPDIVLPEDGGRPQEDLIVDGSTLLQDVINGHYTMEDISVAQGGCKEDQDPVERSALQLFDNIVTYSKKRTQDILQSTDDPRQFFQSLQQSGIDIQNMRPVQLDQCVESAATAIDLMSSIRAEPNEVQDACDSLMKAQLMYEAEVNLKKVAEISDWKRLQILMYRKSVEEKVQKYDEAMAKLGERPVIDETLDKESEEYKLAAAAEANWLNDQEYTAKLHKYAYGADEKKIEEDYDISMKYDLSLLPSDDPNVYKPLEVMCYMGLTRPKQSGTL